MHVLRFCFSESLVIVKIWSRMRKKNSCLIQEFAFQGLCVAEKLRLLISEQNLIFSATLHVASYLESVHTYQSFNTPWPALNCCYTSGTWEHRLFQPISNICVLSWLCMHATLTTVIFKRSMTLTSFEKALQTWFAERFRQKNANKTMLPSHFSSSISPNQHGIFIEGTLEHIL